MQIISCQQIQSDHTAQFIANVADELCGFAISCRPHALEDILIEEKLGAPPLAKRVKTRIIKNGFIYFRVKNDARCFHGDTIQAIRKNARDVLEDMDDGAASGCAACVPNELRKGG